MPINFTPIFFRALHFVHIIFQKTPTMSNTPISFSDAGAVQDMEQYGRYGNKYRLYRCSYHCERHNGLLVMKEDFKSDYATAIKRNWSGS